MPSDQCENGHRIGFRRDDSHGDGWFTLRCVQCEGQPLMAMKCPFCGHKGVRYWGHETKRYLLLLRCPRCANWINNRDTDRQMLVALRGVAPYALVVLVLAYTLPKFGVPERPIDIVSIILMVTLSVIFAVRLLR